MSALLPRPMVFDALHLLAPMPQPTAHELVKLAQLFRRAIYIDFETLPIEDRPNFPPDPVGVAIKWPGRKARYYAFGHINFKNPDKETVAREALRKAWASGRPLCFHHAKFDLAVATEKWGLPMPAWWRVHDTALLLFLRDPRAESFKLKPNATKLCAYPADARDAIVDWLVKHQPVPGVKLTANEKPSKSKRKTGGPKLKYAGGYIAYAPPDLVRAYACDDLGMTESLALKVGPVIDTRKMRAAYDRERCLLATAVLTMERDGVPIDLPKLRTDTAALEASLIAVDDWLCKQAKIKTWRKPDGSSIWDSSQQLAKLLAAAGKVDKAKLGLTRKGKMATNKGALVRGVTDKRVLTVLRYRSRLANSLRGFMRPWLRMAEACGGRIHTTWNSIRKDDAGARTGRLSSTPNFQNIMKKHIKLFGDGPVPAWWKQLGFADLPHLRGYIIAEKGCVLVDRDYSQQELRILAHYAEGELLAKYRENPWFDIHALIQRLTEARLQHAVIREIIKRMVFANVYGMGKEGTARLAVEYQIPEDKMIEIGQAVKASVPGLTDLNAELKTHANEGRPIRTWGGREYFVEEPRMMVDKRTGEIRLRHFEYKLLNLLIQGSAADTTKQAVINLWCTIIKNGWRLLLLVHDELVLSVPAADVAKAHAAMAVAMAAVKFDVPMFSEGKTGANLSELRKYDEKGEIVSLDAYRGKERAKVAQVLEQRKAA